MKKLALKLKESAFAVLPITLTVLVLGLTIGGFDAYVTIGFLVGAVMLIIGMALFTLGADTAMMPIGETMGASLTKTKKLWLILGVSFVTGLLVTIAEPGLLVLTSRLSEAMPNPELNKNILLFAVGGGVGLFLLIAMVRTIFNIDLNKLLIVFYTVVFIVAIILTALGKADFLPAAFDSGGATTGAITVPFIMAYGIGIAAIKGGDKASDSFGYIALASIGPIIAVMIWGVFSTPPTEYVFSLESFNIIDYLTTIPSSMLEVLLPVLMILGFFLIFQFTLIKLPKKSLLKIFIGIVYSIIGLAIFLSGANVGFLYAGSLLGQKLAETSFNWILIPIGVLVGCFIVAAEPAIVVLNEKVEEISGGTIKKKTMLFALMAGIGVSIGLSMLRILFKINIWWMIAPGYLISIVLTFFVPKVFTAVAFDSGGVASGPMTSAFLLPFAMGACSALGGNILSDAFGVIAMVAMTPLITIQIVGLIATIKTKRLAKLMPAAEADDYEIIELV